MGDLMGMIGIWWTCGWDDRYSIGARYEYDMNIVDKMWVYNVIMIGM